MIAASTTEPPVGASTWAWQPGVHRDIGTLTAKAKKKAKKISTSPRSPAAGACQTRMSKLLLDL